MPKERLLGKFKSSLEEEIKKEDPAVTAKSEIQQAVDSKYGDLPENNSNGPWWKKLFGIN